MYVLIGFFFKCMVSFFFLNNNSMNEFEIEIYYYL